MHRTITHILRSSTVLRVSLRQRQGLSFRLPAYPQSRQFSDATDAKLEKSPETNVTEGADSGASSWSTAFSEATSTQPSSEPSEESKTIFVGQLSWGIDSESLAREFAHCGEVVSARIQTDRNTGRSRGFGYVEFATTEAVNAALDLNGKEIDGRTVNVDLANSKRADPEKRAKTYGDASNPPSTSLFVGNINFDVTEGELWDIFAEYGDVKNVRLPTDRDTQRAKGYAFIEYNDVESAQNAVEGAKGRDIGGRPIRLDFATQRVENSGGRGGFGGGRRDDRGGRGGGDRGWGGRGRTGGGDRGGRGGGRGGGGGGGRGYGGSRD